MFKPTVRRPGMSQVKPRVDRKPERAPVIKSATICVDGQDHILPCTIRDFHDKGARFSAANVAAVPDEFMMSVRSEDLVAKCRVSWRKGQEIGVRFLRTGSLADEPRFRKDCAFQFQKLQAKKQAAEDEKQRIEMAKSAAKDAETQRATSERNRLMQLVGLNPNRQYTESDLKQAYRQMAMQRHPDHGGSMEAFTELNNTYRTLMGYLKASKKGQEFMLQKTGS